MKNIKKAFTNYAVSIVIALAVGGISALVTNKAMEQFETVAKPALAPPAWLFPVVWSILYILMGIGAAMVYRSDHKNKTIALIIYGAQLLVNFCWSIFFFNMGAYLFSFCWLILLLVLIGVMIKYFYDVNHVAAYLQIPYIIWVGFAGYLNFMIWMLNK